MVAEQLGGLGDLGDERERAHLGEQVLQAVHQVQGEPRRRPHRQADIGEHDQPWPVLGAAHGDRHERHPVDAHVAAHRLARVDPPRGRRTPPMGQCAVQRPRQPAQRLLQLGALSLTEPVLPGKHCSRCSRDSMTLVSRANSASRWRLSACGRFSENSGQPLAQCGERPFHHRRRPGSSASQPSSASCSAIVSSTHRPGFLPTWRGSRRCRTVQAVGGQLDADVVLRRRTLLGEHDLVGQRGQVDLVGLLVQVVLLRQVLLFEVVPDARRLAVLVTLLRCLAGLLGQGERLQLAGVDEVVVRVAVPVPGVLAADAHQREERVEDLVEHRLVALVLDQGHPQCGAQDSPGGQHTGLPGAPHRVERLGNRDAHPAEPQEPDEAVQGRFHGAAQKRPSPGPVIRRLLLWACRSTPSLNRPGLVLARRTARRRARVIVGSAGRGHRRARRVAPWSWRGCPCP